LAFMVGVSGSGSVAVQASRQSSARCRALIG
jgi:hypothetical protein